MKCTQCDEREAVIHLTQVSGEESTVLHLCEKCAAEKGMETPAQLGKNPLGTFLAAMGQGWKGTLPSEPGLEAVRCRGCGATLEDFRDTGRLGCPECYQTFQGPLSDLLRRLHGATRHVGERYHAPGEPAEAPNGVERTPGLARELRERLRTAVENENFELAAQLRDQLRAVE